MPFIPHTDNDIRTMLEAIGAPDIDALFEEIPANLRAPGLPGVPPISMCTPWKIMRRGSPWMLSTPL